LVLTRSLAQKWPQFTHSSTRRAKDFMRIVKAQEVKNPSQVIGFGDAFLIWTDLPDESRRVAGLSELGTLRRLGLRLETIVSPDESLEEKLRLDDLRHGGKVNLTFCDGHIEQRRTLDMANPDMIPNWDRNNDPHILP
ncbi:MAG: hypothetical protein O2960_29830, partial [Verrucomicrobia bacterium]|nr:hypothetical protein [Verrucomicrobiota bacterium]